MNLPELVDQLTKPERNPVRQQVAPNRYVTYTVPIPSLFDQLEAATRSNTTGTGGGTSDAAARGVLDSGAYALYMTIKHQIDEWCFTNKVTQRDTPEEGLRAWYVSTLATNTDDWAWHESVLREWVYTIRAMLNPRRVLELPNDCPTCDAGTWANDDGEHALFPLVLSYSTDHPHGVFASASVRCRACGQEWRGPEVRVIAWELEHREEEEADA
jgi:hypothetical protein